MGLGQVLKAQINYMKILPKMSIVSTPVKMVSAAKCAPVASWNVTYDQLTEE